MNNFYNKDTCSTVSPDSGLVPTMQHIVGDHAPEGGVGLSHHLRQFVSLQPLLHQQRVRLEIPADETAVRNPFIGLPFIGPFVCLTTPP